MKRKVILAGALLLAACKPAALPVAAIEVRDAWVRETAPGQTSGAAYLTIANSGNIDDKLVAISSPGAQMAMLHNSTNVGGVMAMRMMSDLPIPGTQTITLAPLGTHIMLTGLTGALHPGDRISLTLRFALAGTRHVEATVLSAGSSGPAR